MARTYSDAPRAGTLMKASHVRVLREYIQSDLNAASITFTWGWDQWNQGQDHEQRILALYFTKMRQAIQLLWESKGRGDLPDWTQESPSGPSAGTGAPTRIRATHVVDLRRWLNQYEDNHPPLTQGINSQTYDAWDLDQPVIYHVSPNNWIGEMASLSTSPLSIRAVIRGRQGRVWDGSRWIGTGFTVPFQSIDYAKYRSAFIAYKNAGMSVFGVFTHLFHRPTSDYTSESYRIEYAEALRDFVVESRLAGSELNNIIIWNEPNDQPGGQPGPDYLTPEQFGRLLYRCWVTLKNSSSISLNMPKIYWGGVFSLPDNEYTQALSYIAGVYEFFETSQIMTGETIPFPWDGINIHINSERDTNKTHELLKITRRIQTDNGDNSQMIVGEWGVTLPDGPNSLSRLDGDILQVSRSSPERRVPDIMFYFSHHVVSDGNGDWGIRWVGIDNIDGANRYTLNPYTQSTPDQQALNLRLRFISIMN